MKVSLSIFTACKVLIFSGALRGADAPKAEPAGDDVFKVPEKATAKELIDFCKSIDNHEAKSKDEEALALKAVKTASEKILVLEKGDATPDGHYARRRLLIVQLMEAGDPHSPAWLKASDALAAFLNNPNYTPEDVQLAAELSEALENFDEKRAGELDTTLSKLFEKSAVPEIAQVGKSMAGAAHRLTLPGHAMTVQGTKLDGKKFDLKELDGKVVLVDFWATWCPHCVHEIPAVKLAYAGYHEKGFEVVAISADETKEVVDEFVKSAHLPWVNLYDGQESPALSYYGIRGFPTSILIGKDGKVVSMEARGENLTKLLKELLGEPIAQKELPKADPAKPDPLQNAIKEAIRE